MPNFISSEQNQRSRHFDILIEQNQSALEKPAVQQQLGGLAAKLLEANSQAFLTNLRHRVISVPHEYRDSNGIGVVSTLKEDPRKLFVGHSATLPMASQGQVRNQQTITGALKAFESKAITTIFTNRLQEIDNTIAFTSAKIFRSPFHRSLIRSRSIVFYNHPTDISSSELPVLASIGLHEFLHGIDFQEMQPSANMESLYELRGYRVSKIILDSLGEGIRPLSENATALEDLAAKVDACREQYGIGSDELLNGNFNFTPQHNGLHVDGIIPPVYVI